MCQRLTLEQFGFVLRFSISTSSLPSDLLATMLSPHAPRLPTPHQRDQVVRRPSPAGYLPDTDNRFVKDRTGPDRDERSHYSSMAPNRAIPTEKTLRVSWLTAVGPFSHGRRRSTPVAPSVPANGHKP